MNCSDLWFCALFVTVNFVDVRHDETTFSDIIATAIYTESISKSNKLNRNVAEFPFPRTSSTTETITTKNDEDYDPSNKKTQTLLYVSLSSR